MTVKVTINRDSAGEPGTVEEHPRGADVDVRDSGQLIVTDGHHSNAKVVAVYAPGTWSSAVLEV